MNPHIFTDLRLEAGQEIDVSMGPSEMLIVQEVSLAQLGIVEWQHKVIAVKLIKVIEVVTDHHSILDSVLGELLPYGREISLESFKILI